MIQEVPVLKEGQAVKMEEYDSVEGVGGFLEGGHGAVLATIIHKRWEGKWKVVMRQRCRIGICLELGKGRSLEIWNVYVGHGKHRRFEWVEGDRNAVVMGDFNAWHERWGGDEEVENWEGRRVVDWLDEWGWRLGTPRGVSTRRAKGEVGKDRVLDIGVWVGGLEVEGRVWDWIGGLDHRPIEMEVEVVGVEIERVMEGESMVEWGKVEVELRGVEENLKNRMMDRMRGGRRELEERVEELEKEMKGAVERNKGKRKWREGKKRWWTGRVEREYRSLREVEKGWEEGLIGVERVREKRREFKKVAEEEKREHWVKYLEGLGEDEGYKWVKGDRDFVVNVPTIVLENGERLEKDEDKGVGIMRGLGKGEELELEEEGYELELEVDDEEVEECVMKQGDKKAAGEVVWEGRC